MGSKERALNVESILLVLNPQPAPHRLADLMLNPFTILIFSFLFLKVGSQTSAAVRTQWNHVRDIGWNTVHFFPSFLLSERSPISVLHCVTFLQMSVLTWHLWYLGS